MSIEFKGVSFVYADAFQTEALKNVSFSINEGEFVAILGKTGCGKSTALQLLSGLIKPTSGQVLLDKADINARKYNRKLLRKAVKVVFQFPEYQLFASTVEKDVAFCLKYEKLTKLEKETRVNDALKLMGIRSEYKKSSPFALSGGEKRRVAISGVLASTPKYLILDEPTGGLDPVCKLKFLSTLKKLQNRGVAIIMITHELDAASEYADRISCLDNGILTSDCSSKAYFSEKNARAYTAKGTLNSDLNNGGESFVQETVRLLKDKNIILDALTYQELLSKVIGLFENKNNSTKRADTLTQLAESEVLL